MFSGKAGGDRSTTPTPRNKINEYTAKKHTQPSDSFAPPSPPHWLGGDAQERGEREHLHKAGVARRAVFMEEIDGRLRKI